MIYKMGCILKDGDVLNGNVDGLKRVPGMGLR